MDDPATVKDWLTVIGTVLLMPTTIITATLILNYVWSHWGWWCRIRWQRLVRYVLWLAVNLSAADAADNFWLSPPPIPSRQREDR